MGLGKVLAHGGVGPVSSHLSGTSGPPGRPISRQGQYGRRFKPSLEDAQAVGEVADSANGSNGNRHAEDHVELFLADHLFMNMHGPATYLVYKYNDK